MEDKNKEHHWSKFANDFETKNNYVVGLDDMAIMLDQVKQLSYLGDTLELGCGNGTFTKELARNSKVVLATDFSEQMVNIATSKLTSLDNVFVEKADCFDLHYDDESFDTLFMANLLHVVNNPNKALENCFRVLKPHGRVVLLDFGTEGMTLINKLRLFYRYRKTYGKPSKDRQVLTLQKIKSMLMEVGFDIEKSLLLGINMKAAFVIAVKK